MAKGLIFNNWCQETSFLSEFLNICSGNPPAFTGLAITSVNALAEIIFAEFPPKNIR